MNLEKKLFKREDLFFVKMVFTLDNYLLFWLINFLISFEFQNIEPETNYYEF